MSEKPDRASPVSVSSAHANALAARLFILEEDCREVERCLKGVEGICFEYPGTLPESRERAAAAALKEFLRSLSGLQRGLGLRKRRTDLHKIFNARLSSMWVTLHESKSQELQGYGPVPDDLRAFLDPRVDQLLKLLERLQEILGESQKG